MLLLLEIFPIAASLSNAAAAEVEAVQDTCDAAYLTADESFPNKLVCLRVSDMYGGPLAAG